ncbi:hypothetical protein CPJCM30710_10840 [Clostridium polyendosporum]|uniref:Uncharacterized protein n=1 Tax=Clostridium polyendosporum TaxID=69208 RepID=A0A919S0L3_9CLOT|nr:hypothetical protein [Clostridium polyendosporum]GIM28418.1 hypothetical protein CPJCM30710_10840 [Clostridium polyendosporum]
MKINIVNLDAEKLVEELDSKRKKIDKFNDIINKCLEEIKFQEEVLSLLRKKKEKLLSDVYLLTLLKKEGQMIDRVLRYADIRNE